MLLLRRNEVPAHRIQGQEITEARPTTRISRREAPTQMGIRVVRATKHRRSLNSNSNRSQPTIHQLTLSSRLRNHLHSTLNSLMANSLCRNSSLRHLRSRHLTSRQRRLSHRCRRHRNHHLRNSNNFSNLREPKLPSLSLWQKRAPFHLRIHKEQAGVSASITSTSWLCSVRVILVRLCLLRQKPPSSYMLSRC